MDEQTLYGVKACLAFLEHRPHDLLRLYHAPHMRRQLKEILPWAAARRIPYRELDEEGLRKVAKSIHHEGLVAVTKPLRYRAFQPPNAPPEVPGAEPGPALYVALDGVENPHNLGAILRTCAFFGVRGLLAGGETPEAKVNSAVARVAEGGAEHVPLHGVENLETALDALRHAGWLVIGLETDGEQSLSSVLSTSGAAMGNRVIAPPPLALVLGREREGLLPPVRNACTTICALEGAGAPNSLNVSVAAGVALALVSGMAGAAGSGEGPPRRESSRPARPRKSQRKGPRGIEPPG
jgi:TrmH RNA methyltransferase